MQSGQGLECLRFIAKNTACAEIIMNIYSKQDDRKDTPEMDGDIQTSVKEMRCQDPENAVVSAACRSIPSTGRMVFHCMN